MRPQGPGKVRDARPVQFTEFNAFSSLPVETWVVGSTAKIFANGANSGSCAAAGTYQVASLAGPTVYVEGGPGADQTNSSTANTGSGVVGVNDGCMVEERCHMTASDDSVQMVLGMFGGSALIALGACVYITCANPKGYTLIAQHED